MSSLYAIHCADGERRHRWVTIEPIGKWEIAAQAICNVFDRDCDHGPHAPVEYRAVEPSHENTDCPVCRDHIGQGHPCGFITDMNKGTVCGVNSPPGFIWCGGERHTGFNTTYIDREAIVTLFDGTKERVREIVADDAEFSEFRAVAAELLRHRQGEPVARPNGFCPECGPVDKCDEDRCCLACGADLIREELMAALYASPEPPEGAQRSGADAPTESGSDDTPGLSAASREQLDAGFSGFVKGFMGGHSVEEIIRARAKSYRVRRHKMFSWHPGHQEQIATDYETMLAEIDALRAQRSSDAPSAGARSAGDSVPSGALPTTPDEREGCGGSGGCWADHPENPTAERWVVCPGCPDCAPKEAE